MQFYYEINNMWNGLKMGIRLDIIFRIWKLSFTYFQSYIILLNTSP